MQVDYEEFIKIKKAEQYRIWGDVFLILHNNNVDAKVTDKIRKAIFEIDKKELLNKTNS